MGKKGTAIQGSAATWIWLEFKEMLHQNDRMLWPQRYSTYYRYLLLSLTLPISSWDTRYQSAAGVHVQEQSRIYLPRFSWIWLGDGGREATAESPVVYEEESEIEWSRCMLTPIQQIFPKILQCLVVLDKFSTTRHVLQNYIPTWKETSRSTLHSRYPS